MASQNRRLTLLRWFLVLMLLVGTSPSCSLTQRSKAANKANEKFSRWKQKTEAIPRLLWVDGNNVRGIGKFEWNAVELQNRVVRFCHQHQIETAVVVWDHGSTKFASSASYFLDDDCTDHTNDGFCVNLVILFSGLGQRADDVLVKESNHIVTTNQTAFDWGSLAFVTNDRDLNYKLRNQVAPNPPSIRLGRRKRGGKIYDASTATASAPLRIKEDPLFCDSTGFVEILCDIDPKLSPTEKKFSESIEIAKASIRESSKSQRRGYNPRREKTWERCVQAETLRRSLLTLQSNSINPLVDELHSVRGYSVASSEDTTSDEFMPFLGPSRLDKHQRRMLDRYNALAKKGELP